MEDLAKDFPHELFKAYADKKITRTHFTVVFSEWQKKHGMNFDCKGSGDRNGVYVTYRGVTAAIKGNSLVWCAGIKPVGKRRKRLDIQTAETVFDFQRKVDFALLREWLWKGGTKCREVTW